MVCIPVIGIPCVDLGLNPLSYIKDAIIGSLRGLVGLFETVFVTPPRVSHGPIQDYLYGTAIGTTGKLAVTVAFVVTAYAIFNSKAAHRVAKAFIAIFALAIMTPVWFKLSDSLVEFGNTLASSALFYHPPPHSHSSGSFLSVPGISDLLGAIVGGGVILTLGTILVYVFYVYASLIMIVKFGLLFAIALYGISQKFLYWLIAVGLVSMVFGRAAAILMIEFSKVFADNGLFGNTVAGFTSYVIVGLILALAVQYGLYKGLKNVVSRVAGRVASRVSGTVKTITKRRTPSRSNALAQQAHNGSMPVRVRVTKPPVAARMKSTARDQAIVHGAKKLGASKAAAAAGPEAAVLAAAVTLASKARRSHANRQSSRSA